MSVRGLLLGTACLALGLACGDHPQEGGSGPLDAGVLSDAGRVGASAFPLCARPGRDAVRDVLCPDAVGIRSISDLQRAVGIDAATDNSEEADTRVVLLGHSTALSGHKVSPINPRVIAVTPEVAMAFQRGVQQVELAAARPDQDGFNFYLLTFRQACNSRPQGCLPGDLYTPAVEEDWLQIELRDDEDLKNTASDCRQCHQRTGGPSTLLMRELKGPWTHFFLADLGIDQLAPFPKVSGVNLTRDYVAARGAEPLGGFPGTLLLTQNPFQLERSVSVEQPLLFDSFAILSEVWSYGQDGWGTTPGRSPTWQRGYEAFKRGEQLALPYFRTRATDPLKQQQLSEAYRRYQSGELEADELPDLADIFPDDPQVRAEIGLQVEPHATPAQALIQACGSCHNNVLDQSLTRAHFNIDLSQMDAQARMRAAERVLLDADDPRRMPPQEARQLDDRSRAALVDYLRRGEPSADDVELLGRAARLGMAGTPMP